MTGPTRFALPLILFAAGYWIVSALMDSLQAARRKRLTGAEPRPSADAPRAEAVEASPDGDPGEEGDGAGTGAEPARGARPTVLEVEDAYGRLLGLSGAFTLADVLRRHEELSRQFDLEPLPQPSEKLQALARRERAALDEARDWFLHRYG